MFLHKVLGYRGVVLFPWMARVYDRDLPHKNSNTRERLMDTENPNMGAVGNKEEVPEIVQLPGKRQLHQPHRKVQA